MYLLRDESLSACGISASDRVLIALSGGADSVALLLESIRWRDEKKIGSVVAAHLNHGIRQEEAERDAAFCRNLCKSRAVPFYESFCNVPKVAAQNGESLEAAAREERYRFLHRISEQAECDCIATAHHKNDQAETILMHLLRGCGINGLTGMRYRNEKIVRPMLNVDKADILAYLAERGQSFCVDSTNLSDEPMRNKMRHLILPLLEELNPQIVSSVCRMGDVLRSDADYLETMAERVFTSNPCRKELASEPTAIRMRVLRRYLPYTNFEHTDLETLDALLLAPTGTQRNLKSGYIAWAGSDRLYIRRIAKEDYCLPLSVGLFVSIPSGTIFAEEVSEVSFPCESAVGYLDADAVSGSLLVRSPQDGDRFVPFGMHGTKLLSDYFTDRKVPRFFRNVPLVCDELGILFVAGYTIAERARVKTATQRILKITYKEDFGHVGQGIHGAGY